MLQVVQQRACCPVMATYLVESSVSAPDTSDVSEAASDRDSDNPLSLRVRLRALNDTLRPRAAGTTAVVWYLPNRRSST